MGKVEKPDKPWDQGDVDQLAELAAFGYAADEIGHLLGRTPKAIRDKAAEQGVQLVSAKLNSIRSFGRKGGVFLREFLGGNIGIRWGRAHRSGAAFDRDQCERLLDDGFITTASGAGEHGHVWWKKSKPRKAAITP